MKILPASKNMRIVVITIGLLLVMTILAVMAILVLRAVSPVKDGSLGTTAKTVEDQLRMSAAASENKGDTQKAIATYKELLSQYKKEGNTWGQADMTAKIAQLEGLKDNENRLIEEEKINAEKRRIEAGAPKEPDIIE